MNLHRFFRMTVVILGLVAGAVEAAEVANSAPSNQVSIQMALYFAPEPTVEPVEKLQRLCEQPGLAFTVIRDPDKDKAVFPLVGPEWISLEKYAPPDAKDWQYRTRGLAKEIQPVVATAKQVLRLNFLVARGDACAANERISRLVATLADATGGLPWDEETRNLYSAAAWRTSRVDSWKDGIPDMREQIVMDAYREDEFIRVVTMGMRKFDLSDLVVEGVIAHASRNMGNTINACAQILVEGGKIVDDRLQIDFAAIKHPAVKATMLENPGPGATGKIIATLKPAKPQPGDANNTLLEVDFPAPGVTQQERQQFAIKTLFGATDSLVQAKHNDGELNAASARAKLRLPDLRKHFINGLEPNEHLTVKGPFPSDDGRTEWMWVEVTTWSETVIKGTLVNEPFWVKGLRPGSPVMIKEADIFDYIWIKSDGSREGNETGKILDKVKNEGR